MMVDLELWIRVTLWEYYGNKVSKVNMEAVLMRKMSFKIWPFSLVFCFQLIASPFPFVFNGQKSFGFLFMISCPKKFA